MIHLYTYIHAYTYVHTYVHIYIYVYTGPCGMELLGNGQICIRRFCNHTFHENCYLGNPERICIHPTCLPEGLSNYSIYITVLSILVYLITLLSKA